MFNIALRRSHGKEWRKNNRKIKTISNTKKKTANARNIHPTINCLISSSRSRATELDTNYNCADGDWRAARKSSGAIKHIKLKDNTGICFCASSVRYSILFKWNERLKEMYRTHYHQYFANNDDFCSVRHDRGEADTGTSALFMKSEAFHCYIIFLQHTIKNFVKNNKGKVFFADGTICVGEFGIELWIDSREKRGYRD